MSEFAVLLVVVYAFFEYIEYSLQKGDNLKEVLEYNLERFRTNIFSYMFAHSTFFMLLVLIFVLGVDGVFIYIALFMKGIDLAFKFYLIGKIQKEGDGALSMLFGGAEIPLSKNLKIINSFAYIMLVLFSLL